MTLTTHSLTRSTLVTSDWSYRFGPLEAPLLTICAVDEQGCQWQVDEPTGWDASEAVTPMDQRQYGDGAYAGETTFRPRVLSFGNPQTGVTVAPTRELAAAAMQRLKAIAQTRYPVLYTQSGYPAQSLWLRASGKPNMRWLSDVAFEWAFVMVADDPFRFDAAQLAEPLTTQLPGPVGGFAYDLTYPLGYGSVLPSGSVRATNRGDETSQAVYTLRGPVPRPTVYSRRTGASFTIDRTLAANELVVADTATGQVTLNGVPILDDLIGDLPPILPGDNVLQWSGGSGDPALDELGPNNQRARLWVATTSTWK